jgi:hypothetical protein
MRFQPHISSGIRLKDLLEGPFRPNPAAICMRKHSGFCHPSFSNCLFTTWRARSLPRSSAITTTIGHECVVIGTPFLRVISSISLLCVCSRMPSLRRDPVRGMITWIPVSSTTERSQTTGALPWERTELGSTLICALKRSSNRPAGKNARQWIPR